MNILFIASDNNPYSGAFLSMVKLTKLLQQTYGHHITVVLPYEGEGSKLLDQAGVKSILIRSYDWTVKFEDRHNFIKYAKHIVKTGINRIASYRIAKVIKREKIDLVHINTSRSYVGALAALHTKTPYIWHIREFLEEDQGRQIRNKNRGYSLMRKATRVVAISESIYEKYLPIIGKKKLVTILNGIDPKDYYESDHELFQNPNVQLLMVGGVKEGKGQESAITACLKLLNRGIHNFKLRIVGKGNEKYVQLLEERVKEAEAEDYIEFCGPSNHIPQYYRTSDILLMCSRAEAFGRVTVEAMFAGDLVIGADTAGTKELIKDGVTGLLYEGKNAQALANRIEYAISQKELMKKIAKDGQDYMLNHMTAEINAANINALYYALC